MKGEQGLESWYEVMCIHEIKYQTLDDKIPIDEILNTKYKKKGERPGELVWGNVYS